MAITMENDMSIDVFASQTVTNSRGNTVLINEAAVTEIGFMYGSAVMMGRYLTQLGWQVYETLHDNTQFGVYVNVATLQVLTYSEGEMQMVKARDEASFQAELALMAEFYGEPNLDFSALNPHADPSTPTLTACTEPTSYVLPVQAANTGMTSAQA